MREWINNYGVVCVLAIGLVGGLFLWSVNIQVEAQTSDLRGDNKVFKVTLATIQSDMEALKMAQALTDKRLQRLEDGQKTLRADVKASQQAILEAIRKITP